MKPARWQGETVVCAASGPSLTQSDVDSVRGRARLMVANATFKLAPWADVLYAADGRFWRTYMAEIQRLGVTSELWSMSQEAHREFGVHHIKRQQGSGYAIAKNSITTGGNSGYQIVHLAALWGARRIVLLGFDMQRTGGKSHHHGDHAGGLPNGRNFAFWVSRFAPLARDLKKRGVEVLNCSRETALKCFQRVALESIIW